ncbi:MAG: archaetidylserine decarboxylase [Rhabdochlamydiaceae bacterium]|jgi:phosphatidylserine decarboxylase
MNDITYIDRASGKEHIEKVYGKALIEALYGSSSLSKILSFLFLPLLSRSNLISFLWCAFQKSRFSQFKIKPFIKAFHVDSSEFRDSVDSFRCFNDFFIRHLKPSARPINPDVKRAILPADARYLVYSNIASIDGFWVKGHKFSLEELLLSQALAKKYAAGSMVIARLAPVDYHRFHFPISCTSETPLSIPGKLYSVNPTALKKDIDILTRNKRMLTTLHSDNFGDVTYIEVGATNVGSIHQTFQPGKQHAKGEEKGYFSFGGSCLILLFEPGKIQFDKDLLNASSRKIEVLGRLGQSLGTLF